VQPDDISTGDLAPDGVEVMSYRSNIPAIAEFTFRARDPEFRKRMEEWGEGFIVGGENYGQGSSREHAAIVPRYLGLRAVVAKSYARIHWQNLANFGVLPLEFVDESDYDAVESGDVLAMSDLRSGVEGHDLTVRNTTQDTEYAVRHRLSPRQVEVLLAGGLVPWLHDRNAG
jgi:aconitate hydratase